VANLQALFSNVTDTRGRYTITWTPPTTANGSYYQHLNYSFNSAYTVGPKYNNRSTETLDQGVNEYVIPDAFYFSDYTFIITTINLKYNINNGPVTVQNQSVPAGMHVLFVCILKIFYTQVFNIYSLSHLLYMLYLCTTVSFHFSVAPTAVRRLMAVPLLPNSIYITWDHPLYPNSQILKYIVFYNANPSIIQMFPNIMSAGFNSLGVPSVNTTSYNLTRDVFTNYSIHISVKGDHVPDAPIELEIFQTATSSNASNVGE